MCKIINGTFFFTQNSDSKNITDHVDVVKKILLDGNMVGNHTLSHDYELFYKHPENVKHHENHTSSPLQFFGLS